MQFAFFILFIPLFLAASEPSVFGAGNLNSPNPYGLTETEKHILSNKKTLSTIEKKTFNQSSRVESIQERLDGLQTIVEGINEKSQSNKITLKRLESTQELDKNERQEREKQLFDSISANEASILQLKMVLTEFSSMIDTINTNYVSKEEFNAVIKDINVFKESVAKSFKTVNKAKPKANTYNGMSKGEVATEAKRLYDTKMYTKSIELYTFLIQNNYKPARAHYMIGEMWYYRKSYEKAISYFKESARRYDKASYMPVLMMHTAVAMQKTGDIANAKAFLNALIASYPENKLAADAKVRLAKLQ
ncbi:MAG: tetratricopeptide repeat protein [Campylobacterota bacterium]|nr:tetratricopeptide repeat protein [Campylobacterota bacterium]